MTRECRRPPLPILRDAETDKRIPLRREHVRLHVHHVAALAQPRRVEDAAQHPHLIRPVDRHFLRLAGPLAETRIVRHAVRRLAFGVRRPHAHLQALLPGLIVERPQLGPIATGLGEVFHYVVRSDNTNRTLTELRELQDWVIKPQLRKVAGVAEINSWGGFEKQYHVVTEPDRLVKYGLTLEQLFEALEANNQNVGGGQVVRNGESLLVQGLGLTTDVEQIGNIVIASHDGVPVRVSDVAMVQVDHEIRRGAVTGGGKGEIVLVPCIIYNFG